MQPSFADANSRVSLRSWASYHWSFYDYVAPFRREGISNSFGDGSENNQAWGEFNEGGGDVLANGS